MAEEPKSEVEQSHSDLRKETANQMGIPENFEIKDMMLRAHTIQPVTTSLKRKNGLGGAEVRLTGEELFARDEVGKHEMYAQNLKKKYSEKMKKHREEVKRDKESILKFMKQQNIGAMAVQAPQRRPSSSGGESDEKDESECPVMYIVREEGMTNTKPTFSRKSAMLSFVRDSVEHEKQQQPVPTAQLSVEAQAKEKRAKHGQFIRQRAKEKLRNMLSSHKNNLEDEKKKHLDRQKAEIKRREIQKARERAQMLIKEQFDGEEEEEEIQKKKKSRVASSSRTRSKRSEQGVHSQSRPTSSVIYKKVLDDRSKQIEKEFMKGLQSYGNQVEEETSRSQKKKQGQ